MQTVRVGLSNLPLTGITVLFFFPLGLFSPPTYRGQFAVAVCCLMWTTVLLENRPLWSITWWKTRHAWNLCYKSLSSTPTALSHLCKSLALWWLTQGKTLSKDSPHQNLTVSSLSLFFFLLTKPFNCLTDGKNERLFPQGKNFISSVRKETDGKWERKRTKEGCVLKEGIWIWPVRVLFFLFCRCAEASVRRSLKIRALFHNPLLILASQKSCLLCSSHQAFFPFAFRVSVDIKCFTLWP